MKTVIEMAREAGLVGGPVYARGLERFAEFVRADERNRTWTQEHWTEYERSIAAQEREACAGECDEWIKNGSALAEDIAAAIRARSNT
jgi:hypothetical protein